MVTHVRRRRERFPAEGTRGLRHRECAGDEACHGGDAERDAQRPVGPHRQQFQRVGHRRDEAERFGRARIGRVERGLERVRVLAVAEVGGDEPASRHQQPDDQAADDTLPVMAEVAAAEHEDEDRRRQHTRDRQCGPGRSCARQQGRQVLTGDRPALEVHRHRLQPVDPELSEQPAQGHPGRQAEEHQHHHRLQVAGTDAQQRLAAATGAERHPDTEQQAADDVRQPHQVRAGVDRLRQVDQPGRLQAVGREHRDRDRQQPHAHARQVADVDPVGHGTQRAEMGPLRHRPEHEGQCEAERGDQRAGVEGSFRDHP